MSGQCSCNGLDGRCDWCHLTDENYRLREALAQYSSKRFFERGDSLIDATVPIYHWSLHKKKGGWYFYATPTNGKPWDIADKALGIK